MSDERSVAALNTMTLEPLTCPSCSGPVPLADGDAVCCPFCGASVPLPEAYRALRDENRVADADRARVESAYAALGRPPGKLLRFWAGLAGVALRVVRWWTFAPLFVVFAVVIAFPLTRWLGVLAPRMGFSLVDVLGAVLYAFTCNLVFTLALPAPLIWFRYRTRMAGCRGALAASMAATPPKTPGGRATCRTCGAPLHVETGALGERCRYCGTDNLVALPAAWVARMTSASATRHADAISALDAEARETSAARRAVTWQAIGVLVLACGCAAVCGSLLERSSGVPMGWSRAVAESPRAVYFEHAVFTPDGEDLYRELRVGDERALTLTDFDCDGKTTCYLLLGVPLHRGERFALSAPDLPRDTTASVATPWDDASPDVPWKSDARRTENLHRIGGDIEFTAPYSGWFFVHATLPAMRRRPPARIEARFRIDSR